MLIKYILIIDGDTG